MNETLTLRVHPSNPRARQRVLAGTDDGEPFEVVVPLRIKTVDAAIDWLRPAEVPADALRQGEFFLVPAESPHAIVGCGCPPERSHTIAFCQSEESTDAGSIYHYRLMDEASFSLTHEADTCIALHKSGSVCFVGRRSVKSHNFTARPRYFVRGGVEHRQHGRLELPHHTGGGWYEVFPNKAHGPFPVRGPARYSD